MFEWLHVYATFHIEDQDLVEMHEEVQLWLSREHINQPWSRMPRGWSTTQPSSGRTTNWFDQSSQLDERSSGEYYGQAKSNIDCLPDEL